MLNKLRMITVNKKIQVDTIAGSMLCLLFLLVLWQQANHYSNIGQTVIFTVITVFVIVLNIWIDIIGLKSKYPLMDAFLFIGLILYFRIVLLGIYSSNFHYELIISDTFLFTNTEDAHLATVIYIRNTNLYTFTTTIKRISNYGFVSMFVYSEYGFLSRYDSRFKGSRNKVTLSGLLGNNTIVSSLDPKSARMTPMSRTVMVKDASIYPELDGIVEQKRVEQENKERNK